MVRRIAKRSVSNHGPPPSFETHRFAMLLRMRLVLVLRRFDEKRISL